MASDPADTLEQQNGGGHGCISPPAAPIIGGTDLESILAAYIQEILDDVRPPYPECCIYRVPERLRKINEEAYTPHFVSIGPFHHGKENLIGQETLKWEHLHSFVGRNSDVTLLQYVKTIKGMEERIRKCYAEIIPFSSNECVRMMLVDGCFILEFFLRAERGLQFNGGFFYAVLSDLILLENQLPAFVLEELWKLNNGERLDIFTSIFRSFSFLIAVQPSRSPYGPYMREERHLLEGRHLLDFVRDYFIPSSSANNTSQSSSGNGNSEELQLPHTVTALHKAGVKFEVRRGKYLVDISFDQENGVLAIPCLEITDSTETLLRNMIAFEQLHFVGRKYIKGRKYITGYAALLDSLIDTSKDVELLHDHGIIKNSLGDHEEVSLLFNKLVKGVTEVERDDFYFYPLHQDLNTYRSFWPARMADWQEWMADLRQTYFKTPWTAISVIAAAVLIVLTFLQTIYTIKSYIKQ